MASATTTTTSACAATTTIATSTTASLLESSLQDLERQRDLISGCTRLWKDLSDHFDSLDRHLRISSSSLRSKLLALDSSTELSLSSLLRRERSASAAADLASSHADRLLSSALLHHVDHASPPDLTSSCLLMDPSSFLSVLLSHRHSSNLDLPSALRHCIDPPNFALDALALAPFPAGGDRAWACVTVLEALAEVLRDPVLGEGRKLITPAIRHRAEGIAREWREEAEKREGGIGAVKAPDAHVFLQHVATFDLATEEDRGLYRRLVVASSWRRQMPRLALDLGLGDRMDGIIEELISKGQQLDAVNFAYKANLVDKYPPVPLLKAYLENSVKAATSILEDRNKSGRAVHLAGRKEQSALRAVIKCIEEHKLESEFQPEELKARLEQLEKAKTEKKKPIVVSIPANKRTRASSGGPMPPAKAGRLTNHAHVSSFPSPPSFMRSPSAHSPYSTLSPAVSTYGYDRPSIHSPYGSQSSPYGSQSPPAIRDPYAYCQEEVFPPPMGMSYACSPLSYPLYAGYSVPPLSPGYQPIYYR